MYNVKEIPEKHFKAIVLLLLCVCVFVCGKMQTQIIKECILFVLK